MTVSRVIIHHEGAGAPTDNVDRPLEENYSISIGKTKYKMNLPPERSFRTVGTSGASLQIVLTGDRRFFPVTDEEIASIRKASAEARAKTWLTKGEASVTYHQKASGSAFITVCPGNYVTARMPEIIAAVNGIVYNTTPPTPGEVRVAGLCAGKRGGYYQYTPQGTVHPYGEDFFGDASKIPGNPTPWPFGHPVSPMVDMALTPTGKGYWLQEENGGIWAFGDATPLGHI